MDKFGRDVRNVNKAITLRANVHEGPEPLQPIKPERVSQQAC